MKLRSVVVVLTAAVIGAGAPGFAQAARGDGHTRAESQYNGGHGGNRGGNWDRGDHRGGGSNGLAIALGIGILGAVLASQMNDRPQPQQYGYAPAYQPANQYGYAPAYGYPAGRSPYGY